MLREASSSSHQDGTSWRLRSGRIDNSAGTNMSTKCPLEGTAGQHTFWCKVEEWGQILPVGHLRRLYSEVIKE